MKETQVVFGFSLSPPMFVALFSPFDLSALPSLSRYPQGANLNEKLAFYFVIYEFTFLAPFYPLPRDLATKISRYW